MKALRLMLVVCICSLLAQGCGAPGRVVQGTVVSYSQESGILVVRDETPPHAEISLSVTGAEIGALPEANDLVRVAFREDKGRTVATRVMNLTKQRELHKGND